MAAASLTVILSLGAFFGFSNTQNKSANSFILSVNAQDLEENKQVSISSDDSGYAISEGDNNVVGYALKFPVECKGENIDTVTYNVNNAKICVSTTNNDNIITDSVPSNAVIAPIITPIKKERDCC